MNSQTEQFKTLALKSLADGSLQTTLRDFAANFKGRREAAFTDRAEFERLRDRARRAKERSLARLPELLEMVEANVIAAGGHVHWAADAAEARRIIMTIARENHVTGVVKGKSMTSEEIGINEEFEAAGIEVSETDLGEYIVQMAGEKPSHIIAPAVHKNRRDIGDLFAEKLGIETTYEPEELTAIARAKLRKKFLSAEMGMTGANMVVANSGTVVLVENEGNIRFSTTAPRIQVSLAGIDKVIADFEAMADILTILPRAAAGQFISGYVSILTGPRRADELDGPEEFHLVLLDNGRSRILADPVLREALHCLRCGSCFNVCPVYLHLGGLAYGWIYSGPIGTVLSPLFLERGTASDLPKASTMCGACAEVCPAGIDLPRLMLELRHQMAEDPSWRSLPSPIQRLAANLWTGLNLHPRTYRAAAKLARPLSQMATPPPVKKWSAQRTAPQPAARSFIDQWPQLAKSLKNRGK